MKKVAIVGAHGLYASYGGWDQLLKNLAERKKDSEFEYLIFNSSQSPKTITPPKQVKVKRLNIKSSGFEGLFYDFYSILLCYFKVDSILFLGVQGMPLAAFLSFFKNVQIISNMGGIEWERPKFGFFAKQYLKFCFWLGLIFSKWVILDNEHYFTFVPEKYKHKCLVIPYGGEIDNSISLTDELKNKYTFLNNPYFLSISRALVDNQIEELCKSFVGLPHNLVVISNLSSSSYGMSIKEKYKNCENIFLINGLYDKPELDCIRRNCTAYIHTHTLCGTAPSLVEMIISRRPIVCFDIPQNRFTLNNEALFFDSFDELRNIINSVAIFEQYITNDNLLSKYDWDKIVDSYEKTYWT